MEKSNLIRRLNAYLLTVMPYTSLYAQMNHARNEAVFNQKLRITLNKMEVGRLKKNIKIIKIRMTVLIRQWENKIIIRVSNKA